MASLLCVVKDELPGHALRELLALRGWDAGLVSTAEQALRTAEANRCLVALIDCAFVSSVSGLELCRELRGVRPAMGIVLIGGSGDPREKVLGFDAGADDYIDRSVDVEELCARLRAVLRRTAVSAPTVALPATWFQTTPSNGNRSLVRKVGDVVLGPPASIRTERGAAIDLTPREHSLLWLLSAHPRAVVTRFEILKSWGLAESDDAARRNLVDRHIASLRQKTRDFGIAIRTVRSVGFSLVERKFPVPQKHANPLGGECSPDSRTSAERALRAQPE